MQRPEPALILGGAPVFVYSADTPLAAEDAVVDAVLVDAMAKAGGAHRQRHQLISGDRLANSRAKSFALAMPPSRVVLSSFSFETTTAMVIDSCGPASATWSVTRHFSGPAPLCGASFADRIFMERNALPCVEQEAQSCTDHVVHASPV